MTLRLRQICVVAPHLEPAVEALRATFGLEVCHRDPAVAKYGLENALFVFGHQFLEIVAPTREGTAAGRFLERMAQQGGVGGYMAIFDTHDPERRKALVESLGVRIAHVMDYPAFYGIQLHPRDGRATMLEFDRSQGNESLDGAYWPAGPHWRDFQRLDRVGGIPRVDVWSPQPADLAAHWARIIDLPPPTPAPGQAPELRFDVGAVRFLPGAHEVLATLLVAVPDAAATLAAGRAAGLPASADGRGLQFCGVTLVPQADVP